MIVLKSFILTVLFCVSQEVLACSIEEEWPDLSSWICDINSEMMLRDKDETYSRYADLVTDPLAIADLRTEMQQVDDETCRQFPLADIDLALNRILEHQSLPARHFVDRTQFASAEIWNVSTTNALISCEAQSLKPGALTHQYTNLYYLKYGPVRQGKHLLIRVLTEF